MRKFRFRTDIPYPDLKADTDPVTGQRRYFTPQGPAYSVTTILGALPNPGIDAWRTRVGEEEAKRITLEATTLGTFVHDRLEAYVKGVDYTPRDHPLEEMATSIFQTMKIFGLKKIQEVWGVEVALHLEDLCAGRTDLICKYDGLPTVLDYKTSTMFKPDEYIEKYKLQCAAYSLAHGHMFPDVESLDQGVIMIGIRPNPDYNVPPKVQTVVLKKDEMIHYRDKWMTVLEDFHAGKYTLKT